MIKKKRKKLDEIVFSAKTKLNIIEVVIFRNLMDSDIRHNKLISVNHVLTEYNDKKEAIKNPKILNAEDVNMIRFM